MPTNKPSDKTSYEFPWYDFSNGRDFLTEALISEASIASLENYVLQGRPPGGFFQALLENNLLEAWRRADSINRPRLHLWVECLYNYTPADCHGSPDTVRRWMALGGWENIESQREDELAVRRHSRQEATGRD